MRKAGILAGLILAALGAGWACAQSVGLPTPRPDPAAPVGPPAASIEDILNQTLGAPKPAPAPRPASAPAAAPTGRMPVVLSARIGEHADRTRFVLELSDPLALRTFTLADPNRVVIDLPQVQWHLDGPPRPSGNGAIKSYRYGLFRPGNSRVVIDLTRPVRLSNALVLPPEGGYGYRVVLDLFPTAQGSFDQKSGWPADLKAREAERLAVLAAAPLPPNTSKQKRTVVVDAGHGGLDPGTTGVNGLQEKDLVLAEALKLKAALLSRGYAVHLTRDTDIFIPLRERVNIARRQRADLFISLHADSNPDASVSGLSVYTLSDGRSDREAAALAKRENQSDIIAGVDLSGENSIVAPILTALAQRDTMNKSARFAENVIAILPRATDILPRQPHRSASLAVLVAPDVPAVLIELGYLSNSSDAGQMKTDRWRSGVAEAIASSVDRYFASPGTPVAQSSAP